ncbi:hypothetical protein JR316_0003848 [Psilocybe cubensis]|uniref:Uncharacterized protein n=2 Tax=Psilocybe cubensis TaxID=181762 RepID=A0ACB8H9N8_PSICU|nr:hypothetical protein JR316_0003848 [Psilocybe cubensis]KAH9484367.1 hypothetical protein JR316_0003848 [Psilocybe cubensis]
MVMPSSTWKLRPGPIVAWERPLGTTETAFYLDAIFCRTADTLQQAEVQLQPLSTSQDLLCPSNVAKAWSYIKRQYPLIAAAYDAHSDDSIYFVVTEESLRTIRPREIIFQKVSSAQDVERIAERIVVQDQLLSDKLLACLFILERTDLPGVFHIFFHVAHSIVDGMANLTLLKTFLDSLCRETHPEVNLEHRLQLSVSSESLAPHLKYNVARRRWRKAIASVMAARRASNLKGGHTLPRKVSQITPYTPPLSKTLRTTLTPDKSNLIIDNCRKNGLTFGNAYPVLGQIALTRVLVRRYLRGEIDEEEWQFRIREPMTSAGPLNLRPFLDKDWYEAGGSSNVCVSIGFFYFALPTMPLGTTRLRPGMNMPHFGDLLSKKRFLFRCKQVREQSIEITKHPLFLEFQEVGAPARIQRNKIAARQWLGGGPPKTLSNKPMSPMEQATAGLVFCNGGSSMGNTDKLLPRTYPLSPQDGKEEPLISLKSSTTRLRCRPTELYLGASTSHDHLTLTVYWDNNVYEEDIVTEWLNEVKLAAEFYLGSDQTIHSKL